MIDNSLKNRIDIPLIGMGTWKINDKLVMNQVLSEGIKLGYRLIDTASAYSNEIIIGNAIKNLGFDREKLFITDKVWNTNRGYEEVKLALKTSLKKLKLDYMDIYLIHYPASMKVHSNWKEINNETWRGMIDLYNEGLVKKIGVCNFKIHHLEELKKEFKIVPMINQIEYHIGYMQNEIVDYCKENNIIVEASSPLSNGQIFQNEELINLSKKLGKTVAQICLRFSVQKGIVVIPKTTNLERLKENINIFDFVISKEDMQKIENIKFDGGMRLDSDTIDCFG